MKIELSTIARSVALTVIVLFVAGCASRGSYTDSGERITNVNSSLATGDIRLKCKVLCSSAWGLKRAQARILHDTGEWSELASLVASVGFHSDQTYYYLGRAAEEQGYSKGAETYYKLAKGVSIGPHKCGGLINVCDGLVFPRLIDERLEAMASAEATSKSIASSSTQHNDPRYFKLMVKTEPAVASVRIMNITPKYEDQMALAEGSYNLLVEYPGYKSYQRWISLDSDKVIQVSLEKETVKANTQLTAFTSSATPTTGFLPAAKSVNTSDRNRTALVIGNSKYQTAPLKNPSNDATDIAAALTQRGFDVTLRTDINQMEMEESVREFYRQLQRRGGVGLFYYAGHGIQVNGQNYLIPINSKIKTETDARYNSVPLGKILGYMHEADTDLNILILDACRNNPIESGFRSMSRGLAKVSMPRSDLGYLVAYSTEPGEVALDGAGRNSPFTHHLLQAMQNRQQSLSETFKQVRRNVYLETNKNQHPLVLDATLEDVSF